MNRSWIILIIIFFTTPLISNAQLGYAKDSLQIKVYTQIDYLESKPVRVFARKVFCDYCSEKQREMIANEAVRRTHLEQNNPKYVIKNGKARLALFIRVAKKDFAKIKEDN